MRRVTKNGVNGVNGKSGKPRALPAPPGRGAAPALVAFGVVLLPEVLARLKRAADGAGADPSLYAGSLLHVVVGGEPPAPPRAPLPWERPGWRTQVLRAEEYDGEPLAFIVGLKEPGDDECSAADTLAVVYAQPYRTADEAEEVAADIAADPATLGGAADMPGVIDRRKAVARKFPPAAGKGASRA